MVVKYILDDLIERYEHPKEPIDKNYTDFFEIYLQNIQKEREEGQSKGDRYFVFRNFKPPFIQLLQKKGFDVIDEVDLYNPKNLPVSGDIVKDEFSDFKKSKKIDFVAIRNKGKKKIIFIEIKMTAGTNAMLSGLFEFSIIDEKKLPNEYEPYYILISSYTNSPKKYAKRFEVLKRAFKYIPQKNCKFVLLDPRNCINETDFYNNVLG